MIDYYLTVFKRWLDFRGRSRRSEYWYYTLANLIVAILLVVVEMILGIGGDDGASGPLSLIYSLVTIVPGLSLSFRRLHDIGRSAWWLLLTFIPIIGWGVLLYWAIKNGDPNRNDFGPDPKSIDDDMVSTFN
jgi:uncharacterized membrane protein YhaH (DUF805 family)